MKNQTSQIKTVSLVILFFIFLTSISYAQVGINTTTPSDGAILDVVSTDKGVFIPKLDVSDLSTIAPVTGIGVTATELLAAEGLMVYNTNTSTGPGFFFWTGTKWESIRANIEPTIDSVSLSTDIEVSAATWANVTGMTLTFTARKTAVLVQFDSSGFSYTNSMAFVEFRVRNTTSGTTVGGTNTNMQSYDDLTGIITTWSCSFSKLLTGLTIGNTYTLTIQGQVTGILGTHNAVISALSDPDAQHLTLSVIH